jgi:Fungal Zn(2)-Cys(6) binuclear cluster domain.
MATKKTCSYRRARAGRPWVSKKEICCVCIPPAYASRRSHRALTYDINSCRRCHSHKTKCSGDQPCSKCCTVGLADECTYATRDRQVKVSEKYAVKPLPIIRPRLSKACLLQCQAKAKTVFYNQLFRSDPRRESAAQGTIDHLGSSYRDKRCSPEVGTP